MERRRAVAPAQDDAKITEAVQSVKKETPLIPLEGLVFDWSKTLSTGSTLLDLAISSGKTKYGGVPGGVLVEIYGRSGSGKTSILSELCGSAQARGGDILYLDPEARLDETHALTYGMQVPKEKYFQPDTVAAMFEILDKWETSTSVINVLAADSLAALSTELELEKGDKMGMRRAKEFSEGMRKYCRKINKQGWIMACSNQVRQGDYGDVTPGGKAIEFYSSIRISVNQKEKLYKEKKIASKGKDIKRCYGIVSSCIITKSSVDKPYREVPLYITFDYGIDDIRANLQWLKDTLGLTKYWVGEDHDGFQQINAAINYIEESKERISMLRDKVVAVWNEIETAFSQKRVKKIR